MFIVSLILLMVVLFAGMVFFLKSLLSKNVTNATSHLQGMIRDYSGREEEIKKKLAAAQKEYEDSKKKAQRELEDLKIKKEKEIEAERDKIIEAAHRQSEEIVARAKTTANTIRLEIEKEINQRAVVRSGELICRMLPEEACLVLHTMWIELLMSDGMNELDRLRIPDEVTNAQVQSAFALTLEQKEKLQKKLEEKLNRKIFIEEVLKTELIAGMVISLGNLIFDGSFLSKIQEEANELIAGKG